MKKLSILIPAIAISLCMNAVASVKVIYGDDNRVDVYASENSLFVELSKSTAAMISSSKVTTMNDGTVRVSGSRLTSRGICSSERFANQISAANCSGFLVGEDTLVTAGHCIEDMSDCRSYKWVFNFAMESEAGYAPITREDVYSCKSIVKTVLDRGSKNDFAVIKLDRAVTGRAALQFRTAGSAQRGESLVVIGHPTGLPTKIADGANVRSVQGTYFTANLDTYGGNSGSAVFNAESGVVEGILVRGDRDYVSRGGCQVSNVVSNNGGMGEHVTKAAEFAPFVR